MYCRLFRLLCKLLYAGVCRKCSVDRNTCAIDKSACLLTCQEQDGTDQFLDLAETIHRRIVQNLAGSGRRCSILIEQKLRILLCGEKSRCDRVAADTHL